MVYPYKVTGDFRLLDAQQGVSSHPLRNPSLFGEHRPKPRKTKTLHCASKQVRPMEKLGSSVLDSALSGDSAAVRMLVDTLTPIIQARVARRLLRSPASKDVRQDVKDLSQDVFLHLFEKSGRVLRSWDPDRGMSLENYVGLIAERRAISHFRSGKSNPWRETDNLDDVQEPQDETNLIERQVSGESDLSAVLACMKQSLSPLGWRLFDLLYINEQSIEQVHFETNMSADALYAWRSRLKKQALKCQQKLLESTLR